MLRYSEKIPAITNLSFGIESGCREKVYFLEFLKYGEDGRGKRYFFTGNIGCFAIEEMTCAAGKGCHKKVNLFAEFYSGFWFKNAQYRNEYSVMLQNFAASVRGNFSSAHNRKAV